MHVISRPAILAASRRHPDAAAWLSQWWTVASRRQWRNLRDVRDQYPATDQVGGCLIFNVRGNTYRLICRITYANQWQHGTLLVKHFLTHADYDKDEWKKDCAK
jgi:mRNA interferase HigB